MSTFAVTGGAGFVGSWITQHLIERGHSVVVIDDHSSGVRYQPLHPRCQLVDEDLRTLPPGLLSDVDAVVHAAAYAQLRRWTADREERTRLLQHNVRATQLLLEVIPDVPVVYLGTASVYGSQPGHTFVEGEESPETCESFYAASKLAGEHLVAAWAKWRGVPWHVARLVNVVGARMHRGVIVDFVKQAKATGRIHAADDGSQRKSWVHVEDVAGAVATMLDAVKRPPSGVYNVTSAERWSWRDIVRAMGVPDADVTCEARPTGAVGDPRDLCASSEKLRPWYRCERPIADGVRAALHWLDWDRRAA